MIDYQNLFNDLFEYMENSQLKPWLKDLEPILRLKLQERPHGDLKRWLDALDELPEIEDEICNYEVVLNDSRVGTKHLQKIDDEALSALENGLRGLIPWRKGPYELFGVHVDTEWRSDWKWERIREHISPLKDRLVLDVGCGSGYHCWRMLGEGAKRVIGIDPSYLFLMQFEAIKKYCGANKPIHLLPVRMEDVTPNLEAFDSTFSMGVLYHRKSPIDHLLELKGTLKKGGELILETLVVEGELGYSLMPEDRYAMMRNVWYIPSTQTLELWLRRAGFKNIRCINVDQTRVEEQRVTDWMQFQSLKEFLDPEDLNKTIEGYPAPLRATFVAQKPK